MKRWIVFFAILWATSLALTIVLILKHAQAVYICITVGCLGIVVLVLLKLVVRSKESTRQCATSATTVLAAAPQGSQQEQSKWRSSESGQSKIEKGLRGWFIGFGVLLLLFVVLGWFDNTTELSPSHDNVLQACFVIAGIAGLVCGGVAIRNSKRMAVWRRSALALSMTLLGFLSVFLVTSRSASMIAGWIDFPPSKTRTYQTVFKISRAYQTHGKGRSWNVQTTPIWSNLEITEDDYKFMLNHQLPGDAPRDPDEILSNGYFCARVAIQQSGGALRVMNAGSHKLPKGTVIICPASSGPASRK